VEGEVNYEEVAKMVATVQERVLFGIIWVDFRKGLFN
jgi:hypothetical protein